MKKIIIALDFDQTAEHVAQTGFEIAKGLGAQVTLVHVVGEPAYYTSRAYSPIMGFTGFELSEIDMEQRGLHKEAKRFLEEAKRHLGDEMVDTAVLDGDVTEAIMSLVNSEQADMVVMGTHSRRGLEKLLVGNLAQKVMDNITVPLIAVPTNIVSAEKNLATA
jgi:nucleotide-binding universal stress UspA family protein